MESQVEFEMELIFQEENHLDLHKGDIVSIPIQQATQEPEVTFDAGQDIQPSTEDEVTPTQKIIHALPSTKNCPKQKGRPGPCTICGKVFQVFSQLQYHMLVHNGEKPYICSFCGYGFRRRYELIRHQRQYHAPEIPKSTMIKMYKCIICGRENILTFSGLRQHRVRSHPEVPDEPDKEKPFACTICDKRYWLRQDAIICAELGHKKRMHKKMIESWKENGIPEKILNNESPLYIELPTIYQEEERKVTYIKPKYRDRSYKPKCTRTYVATKRHNPEVCQFCNLEFPCTAFYERHLRNVHQFSFSCRHCGRILKNLRSLRQHEIIHNPSLFKFQCDQCSKSYPLKQSLEKHRRSVHHDLGYKYTITRNEKISVQEPNSAEKTENLDDKPLSVEINEDSVNFNNCQNAILGTTATDAVAVAPIINFESVPVTLLENNFPQILVLPIEQVQVNTYFVL